MSMSVSPRGLFELKMLVAVEDLQYKFACRNLQSLVGEEEFAIVIRHFANLHLQRAVHDLQQRVGRKRRGGAAQGTGVQERLALRLEKVARVVMTKTDDVSLDL